MQLIYLMFLYAVNLFDDLYAVNLYVVLQSAFHIYLNFSPPLPLS
jgi:hypothetical protein